MSAQVQSVEGVLGGLGSSQNSFFEMELELKSAVKLAFIVPFTVSEAYHQSGYPHWRHVAVVIPLKNYGCILLDPALRLDTPVVLRGHQGVYEADWREGPPTNGARKSENNKWCFVLDVEAGKVNVYNPQQLRLMASRIF